MEPPEHARAAAPGGAGAGDPMVGRLLDRRYRIGARVARGGMASVYEATDIRLDRTVAVKIMHPGMGDDEEFAARFVREARAAARLSHPHVVAVYDQGKEDGTVYLAMELVPGHTLRDVIRKESPMPPARALALLEPVLSALAAAHRAGLIHRDVKPENVLIADDGRVKVADFGLVSDLQGINAISTGGLTPTYAAPETFDGLVTRHCDQYSLAIVYQGSDGAELGRTEVKAAKFLVGKKLAPEVMAKLGDKLARATARAGGTTVAAVETSSASSSSASASATGVTASVSRPQRPQREIVLSVEERPFWRRLRYNDDIDERLRPSDLVANAVGIGASWRPLQNLRNFSVVGRGELAAPELDVDPGERVHRGVAAAVGLAELACVRDRARAGRGRRRGGGGGGRRAGGAAHAGVPSVGRTAATPHRGPARDRRRWGEPLVRPLLVPGRTPRRTPGHVPGGRVGPSRIGVAHVTSCA